MTYPIIVLVVVVAVALVLLALFRRKPEERLPPSRQARPLEPGEGARPSPKPDTAPKPPTEPSRVPDAAAEHKPPQVESPPVEPPVEAVRPAERASVRPKHDVPGLRKGLAKARSETGFLGRLAHLFAGKKELDPSLADQVEEILLTSDVGVAATKAILERLRDGLNKNELSSPQAVWDALRAEAARILGLDGGALRVSSRPTVVFVVGVNGVGKTTSIGKLATKLMSEGKSVLLAAGDTFRAAAVQQLEIWGRRVGCEVVKGKEGADPAAVIFDAVQRAKQNNIDVVLADSAGRLQTKLPLMDELKKIARTMQKALDGAPHETLLVLDATNGQNATSQARMFQDAIPLTGIILTKLDGTAKGGVILGICDELKIPVRYVGIGERAEDLREFIADEFVEALFGRSADETAAA
jgi:fused signal recognition particle receptor